MFKNVWKHSKLRFYILNITWNYRFWLFSKKVYKDFSFEIDTNEYDMDSYFNLIPKKKKIQKKRFIGYMYNQALYIDNPGIQGEDQETWNAWRKKGLLN